jgi:hypothetical protein
MDEVLMLRSDFLDADTWTDLASVRSLRLPSWNLSPTPRLMRRWLKRISVSWADYTALSGDSRMTDFARRNSRWPMCAWIGLLLEWTEDVSLGVHGEPESIELADVG